MIYESLASPASAASPPPCQAPSVTYSWIYILYRVGTAYYVTGFATGDTACDVGGANPNHGTLCVTGCPSGVSFTLTEFGNPPPSPATNDATYSILNSCAAPQSNVWTYQAAGACGQYIVFNNGIVGSTGGAEILAAVGFGAGVLHAICPSTAGPGNQICAVE